MRPRPPPTVAAILAILARLPSTRRHSDRLSWVGSLQDAWQESVPAPQHFYHTSFCIWFAISILTYLSACLASELCCPEPTWGQGPGRMPRSTRRDRSLQHARLKPNRHRVAGTATRPPDRIDVGGNMSSLSDTHMARQLWTGLTCRHQEAKTRAPVDAGTGLDWTGLGRRARRQPAERGLLAPGSSRRQGSADVSLFSTRLLLFFQSSTRPLPV